jgi:hypothetical protein
LKWRCVSSNAVERVGGVEKIFRGLRDHAGDWIWLVAAPELGGDILQHKNVSSKTARQKRLVKDSLLERLSQTDLSNVGDFKAISVQRSHLEDVGGVLEGAHPRREAARVGGRALEQAPAVLHHHVRRDRGGTGGLAEDHHTLRVAPERRDIVLHPAQRLALILRAVAAGGPRVEGERLRSDLCARKPKIETR